MSRPFRIALETVVVRRQNHLAGDIDDEIVLLSIEQGEYYQLAGAGSRIWELMASPVKVSAMVDRLCEEFDVAREACEREVLGFLEQMRADGLIDVADA